MITVSPVSPLVEYCIVEGDSLEDLDGSATVERYSALQRYLETSTRLVSYNKNQRYSYYFENIYICSKSYKLKGKQLFYVDHRVDSLLLSK